ncbi:MAG: hypothetical protein IPJ39_04310 [Saprospiraceae bacterium]|nr:hypothetical protein [Saprospiraceae bacterium]
MEIYIKVLVISILTFCGNEIYAQKLIDINQAKKIAIANNQKIRVANLEVLKQKASINKAFDLGNTQISGELGQFNSAFLIQDLEYLKVSVCHKFISERNRFMNTK